MNKLFSSVLPPFAVCLLLFTILNLIPTVIYGQNARDKVVSVENLQDDKTIALDLEFWKFRIGDEADWAARNFDDGDWQNIEESKITPEEMITSPDWNGRVWFRLPVSVDESAVNRQLVLITALRGGAAEIFLDGNLLARFGEIGSEKVVEYNPNNLPIPFKFDTAGEHTFAVRFASRTYADTSKGIGRWLVAGNVLPSFSMEIKDAENLPSAISSYANSASMRIGFLFVGVLLALALLHFLLYVFYRVERANLFYSVYAASFALFLLLNNFKFFGHQSVAATIILGLIANALLAVCFLALLGFLYVAFQHSLGKVFWILLFSWAAVLIFNAVTLNRFDFTRLLSTILIGLLFTFSILQLIRALREKRAGAWILTVGVQIFAGAMFINLLASFKLISPPSEYFVIAELFIILAVPIAVSVFLARGFARTNRDLTVQLEQVERLSQQKIEQERRAAELHAENERRARELEEARQLQMSMLPKKLPEVPNLEIAAYMRPATEVGGDYYDFHVGADGTLTVAVGDATGHGLKAGTVVTATKSLFNNLASAPDIPDTFNQISRSLKQMNLRGLFMAMTMLKIKDRRLSIGTAGMPSALIFRAASGQVEEIAVRAIPLGSLSQFSYKQQEINLSEGDCVMIMSDGFPEMFSEAGEMLGFEKSAEILPEIARRSPQEIINYFVKTGENWAGVRPPDDDVTFVVLKFV